MVVMTMDEANEFGTYLKTKREIRGFSVNQLALKSGVSAAQISRIENGVRGNPKPDTIQKLATALKVDYQEMMEKAGYLIENNQSDENKPNFDANDPYLNNFYKDFLSAPEEKRKQLMDIWEVIKIDQANRKPGDKQK